MTQTNPPSHTYEQALERAARIWGIEPEYFDTWGNRHVTTPEIQRGILSALGVPCATAEEIERAVAEKLAREWESLLPPVFVAGEQDWPDGFPLSLPAELASATAIIETTWEDGVTERQELPLAVLPEAGRIELCGRTFVRKRIPMPPNARLGYHDVDLHIPVQGSAGLRASMRLILCPDRVWAPAGLRDHARTAGIALALYGLRSERNWGCGDCTDLEAAIDWVAAETGASFIGLNPLHAIPNRQPFNISPYLPASAFFKNPIYVDLDRVEDFHFSRRAQNWVHRPEVQQEIAELRRAPFVEYERVWALKLHGLKLAFASFERAHRDDSPRRQEFQRFVEREGDLLDRYATWCALDEWLHRRFPNVWLWPDWPEEFREPDSIATTSFAEKHRRLVRFYKYAQWQIDVQLAHAQQHARARGLSIGLYHDLALATDRFGADLWAHRPLYVSGCRVGAPPDGFSPKGQDWSFPPPHSDHHRESGYELFAESIRKNCRHGGALRFDHVMRFFRLYWIPEGLDPAHGAYVLDRYEELLHIIALESVRAQVVVVGEDLGTVTPQIREALDRFGIYGYKVPYFEKHEDQSFKLPGEYAESAMVASSTHDLPTLAGYWMGRDIEARRECGLLPDEVAASQHAERTVDKQRLLDSLFSQGLLPDWYERDAARIPELTGELHNAITGWIARAPSRLLAMNQEDLLKEVEQQNLPATTSEHPNWRRKMRYTVEELNAGAARDYTTMFRNWLTATGRA